MTPASPARAAPVCLVTCEHGGSRVPRAYRTHFHGAGEVLASHRGWDPGALRLARALALLLSAPLRWATVTRLLVDLNRSPGHPRVFSEFTRPLPSARREELLRTHHAPYRDGVAAEVERLSAGGATVVHLGVHSFTPVLAGAVRRADIGLLYDPGRDGEAALCSAWAARLRRRLPDLAVRRNQPYRGVSDGLTTWLRRRFGGAAYLGIEIEVNQRLLGADGTFPRRIVGALGEGLRSALGSD